MMARHTLYRPTIPRRGSVRKEGGGWVGYKLQVSETDDEDQPHLITDIAITSSVETDYRALGAIQDRLEDRDVLPGQQLGDAGYVTEDNLVDSAKGKVRRTLNSCGLATLSCDLTRELHSLRAFSIDGQI